MAILDAQELLTDPFLGQKAEAASGPLLAPQAPVSATDPLVKEIEEARTGRKAAAKEVTAAEAEIIQRQQEKVKPALEHLSEHARAPHGEIPKALTDYKEEAPPSMAIRPFLDADTKNSIQAVVAGIGTLITAAIGGRAPIAAMHAFTGAMDGWAAGDTERANRSFQDYQARIGKLHRETGMAVKRAEWARQLSMDDMERAQAWVTTSLADVGMSEKVAELKEKGLARWLQDETMAFSVYTNAQKQYNEQIKHGIEAANVQARQLQAQAAMRRAGAYEEYVKSGGALRGKQLDTIKTLQKVDAEISGIHGRLTTQRDLKQAISLLDKEGAIPRGGTKQEIALAHAKLNFALMNRPDVAAAARVVRSWGTSVLVGRELELQMGKVAAMRFKALAEAEAGDVLAINKPFWDQALKQIESTQREHLGSLSQERQELSKRLQSLGPTTVTPPNIRDILESIGATVEEP